MAEPYRWNDPMTVATRPPTWWKRDQHFHFLVFETLVSRWKLLSIIMTHVFFPMFPVKKYQLTKKHFWRWLEGARWGSWSENPLKNHQPLDWYPQGQRPFEIPSHLMKYYLVDRFPYYVIFIRSIIIPNNKGTITPELIANQQSSINIPSHL